MRRLSALVRGASPRAVRARARKLVAMAGIVTVVGAGAVVATAASASAHTGNASATCSELTVTLTNFQPKQAAQANHVTVTINGATKVDKDFGESFVKTFAFNNPYRAKGNSWTVSWTAYDDARFSGSVSGTASPCDRPDQPTPLVEHRNVTGDPDCESQTVTTEHQSRTQIISWDYDRWNAVWGDWVTDSTTTEQVKPGQCGPGEQPEPIVKYGEWQDQAWPCGATTTTQTRTKSVTEYTLVDGEWKAGEPVVTTETRTRDLAAGEITSCPVPQKPAPVVVQSSTSNVDCSAKKRTVTTTTTTTDWVLNDAKTAWVKGAPVVTTAVATYDTTAAECPVTPTTPPSVGGVKHTAPPAVAPVVEGVKHSAAAPAALAYTGSEAGTYGAVGLVLLVAGSALVLVTRRRTARG